MIFQDTWQGEPVLHEAYMDNGDVLIREVTLGGDPIEDFVSYHPNIGASDDDAETDDDRLEFHVDDLEAV